jgi:penicillin-binding protein 1C
MAAMVVDNRTGEVMAYMGNVPSSNLSSSPMVDVISSKRSYGSLLKPFLYGLMLSEGLLYPRQLVNDIPVAYAGFAPQNFSRTFEGVVPANEIISRSLNVPSVNLLQQYGIEKFHSSLKQMGITSINKPAGYYGLSIILGGAEARLWELSGIYAALALQAQGIAAGSINLRYVLDTTTSSAQPFSCSGIGSGAAYLTLEALTQANRPGEDGTWRNFVSSQKIAWKTGTSYGFRDAGLLENHSLTLAVWGNAEWRGKSKSYWRTTLPL